MTSCWAKTVQVLLMVTRLVDFRERLPSPRDDWASPLPFLEMTEEEYRALEAISVREKLPVSRYVREGVSYIIRRYSK